MAQNITIAGASYSDVPAIDLPKTGGGTARFVDTSDADATASDIAQSKTAYVNGSKVTGTGGAFVQTCTLTFNTDGVVSNPRVILIDANDVKFTSIPYNGQTFTVNVGTTIMFWNMVGSISEYTGDVTPVGYQQHGGWGMGTDSELPSGSTDEMHLLRIDGDLVIYNHV